MGNWTCPKCGQINNHKYCISCGASKPQQTSPAKKSKLKTFSLIIGILIVLVSTFTSPAFFGGNQSKKTESENDKALKATQTIITSSSDKYSYDCLKNSLLNAGYSEEAIVYALNECGENWSNNAVAQASALLSSRYEYYSNYDNLIYALYNEQKFTKEQAVYAANSFGLYEKTFDEEWDEIENSIQNTLDNLPSLSTDGNTYSSDPSIGYYVWKRDAFWRKWFYHYDENGNFMYRDATITDLDVYFSDEPETFPGKKNTLTTYPLYIEYSYNYTSITVSIKIYDSNLPKEGCDFILYCLEPDISKTYQNEGVLHLYDNVPVTYTVNFDTPKRITAIALRPDSYDAFNYSFNIDLPSVSVISYEDNL